MTQWRLIPVLEAPGTVQMAIDRWLLEQHRQGRSPSVLRFYTWSPPAISLGYHQRQYPASWQNLVWQGKRIDLVRRPTGGRAVLHQGDLTYMVVTSSLAGRRIDAYQEICQFLIKGWRSLGIQLNYGNAGQGYIGNPNCFGTATAADLVTVAGQKLIGSAQLRRGAAILQHGSMTIAPDSQLFAQVFGEPASQKLNLPLEAVVKALIEAATRCFRTELVEQPLVEAEWQEILKLLIYNTEKVRELGSSVS